MPPVRTVQVDAIRVSTAHGLDEIDGRNQMVGFTCLQRELLIKEAGPLAHLGTLLDALN
jgi:hypothetical protein